MFRSIGVCFFLICNSVSAAQLIFPLERNNLKPLPIRFEYSLVNKDQIKIGSSVIDVRQIEVQFFPLDNSNTNYKIILKWPAEMLKSGELVIKDSSGKSIWSEVPKVSDIKYEKKKGERYAIYETQKNISQIVDSLKKIPFFKFCIIKEEPQARVYLCSKDLYLKPRIQPIAIEARDSFRKESFMEINGKVVDEQGIIVLNDKKDFVSMRALLLSGASLEIETKLQEIDFVDVSLDANKANLFVTAKGARPADNMEFERLEGDLWRVKLDPERPFLFVLGQGDIPLRQEFLIQGPIKQENLVITTNSNLVHTVFSKQDVIELEANEPVEIESADKKSTVTKVSDTKFNWQINEIDKGKVARRWIKVTHKGDSFFAATDVLFEDSKSVLIKLYTPLWMQFEAEWILPNMTQATISYDKILQKSETDPEISIFTAGWMNRGLGHFKREAGNLFGLDLTSIAIESERSWGVNFVFGFDREISKVSTQEKALMISKFSYYLADLSGTLTSKSSYLAELGVRKFLPSNGYYEFGLRVLNLNFTSKEFVDYKYSKTAAFVGFGMLF